MKRIFILLSLLFLISTSKSLAQSDYKFGVGLRVGWPTGVSAKYFFSQSWAVEGIGTGRFRGIGLTLLLQKHKPLGDDFKWYYGGGFHGSFYSGQYYNGPHKKYYDEDTFSWGLDAVGGLEYVFSNIPISISADIKPALEINYGPYFSFGTAATVRYVF
jgi:hypothetical protein